MAKTANWSIGHFKIIMHIALLHLVVCNSAQDDGEETGLSRQREPTWRNGYHQFCNHHQDYNLDGRDDEPLIRKGSQNTESLRGRPNRRRVFKNQRKPGDRNVIRDQKNASGLTLLECGTSVQDKHEILDEHNLLRTLIAQGLLQDQPRGINMKKLMWDDKLATEAENVAKIGSYGNVQVNDTRFLVGQNVFVQVSTESEKSDWVKAITAWFNERNDYKFGPTTIGNKALHYTQVVWAETHMLGCGRCHFSKDNSKQLFHLYVCNYGPAGNNIGDDPYVEGTDGCKFLC